jgi:hypothetical protein
MADELDPRVLFDAMLLGAMRGRSELVADGVLAHVIDRGNSIEVRAVLATEPRIPGAVGAWLDALPTDRTVVIPAVVSARLAGMLERRGFAHQPWYDHALDMPDEGTWIRRATKPCVVDEHESLQADYQAALDVITRLTTGWDAQRFYGKSPIWHRPHFFVEDEATETTEEPMSDREWRVFCDAAQRATRNTT